MKLSSADAHLLEKLEHFIEQNAPTSRVGEHQLKKVEHFIEKFEHFIEQNSIF
jgi:hypothetical protein